MSPTEADRRKEAREAVEMVVRHGMDDLHEAIGIGRNAGWTPSNISAQVKKRTRQLLLLVHPDKNDSPLAGEAVDIVNTAARVLPDARAWREHQAERKRKHESDQLGPRSPAESARGRQEAKVE